MGRGVTCALVGVVCLLSGCHTTYWRTKFYLPPVAKIDREAPFIKCHTADGHVMVLNNWNIDQESGQITGSGIHYDDSRQVVERGKISLAYRQVLVLEASQPERVFNGYKGITMGVLSGLSLLLTIILFG